MSEKSRMLSGELYWAMDPELVAERQAAEALLGEINLAGDTGVRNGLLHKLLGRLGKDAVVRCPFYCDYGYNIHIDDGVFLNFNCVLLDVMPISIGEGTQIGPAVQIYAAGHPIDPEARLSGKENGKPVRIGKNVWIGGGAIILPGITIGDGAVIGAGSVVTRDLDAGQIVCGNPAREIRRGV